MANIIITGANQGIGYYMTEKLLIDGNKVSVLDIETDSFEKLKKQYSNSLIYHKVDLRSYDEVNTAWIICPTCGGKTRDRIREDTILINYPLYCPKCKQENLIEAKNFIVTVIREPDTKMQSR